MSILEFWLDVLVFFGLMILALIIIWATLKPSWNMDSNVKLQTIAIMGLAAIAIVALIIAVGTTDSQNIITLAGVAVGGIAGFISQKSGSKSTTSLFTPGNVNAVVGIPLTFALNGINTSGDALTYSMSSTLPEDAKLDSTSGVFEWTPLEEQGDQEFNVTFTVTDSEGGSDSKSIKITVIKKISP